jgi:putative hydrolase of the HAD superfamily
MQKILCFLIAPLWIASSLFATPQAIVFDFGSVMTKDSNWKAMDDFVRESFSLSQEMFDVANLDKYESLAQGKTDEEFWLSYANDNAIELPSHWAASFRSVMQTSLGVNLKMYALVGELQEQNILVAMLSNTTERRSKIFRSFGLYKPFDPCLLSCEIGLRKPDPKVYELLLKTLNLPAQEVIFVDDKLENIEAAKKLGIDAILFESEEQLKRELAQRGVLQ